MSPEAAISEAVRRMGGQNAAARRLGISQTSVWRWVSKGQTVPGEHVLDIEAATGISRHDLRPDLYPREDSPAQPPAGSPLPPAGGSRGGQGLEGLRA